MARSGAGRLALTGVVAMSFYALAIASPSSTKEWAGDITTLTKLSDDWDKAIVRKDEKAIADNMAEDFRMIDGRGDVSAKKAFVADLIDPKLTIDPYTVEEFTVRLYGVTALLSGRTHMTGRFDGQPFESNYRYIDIYVRKGGSWKIVSVQITKFPPAKAD